MGAYQQLQTLSERARHRERAFSLGALYAQAASGGVHSGYEAEVCQQAAIDAGTRHAPLAPIIPWNVFQRDLTVAAASGGGYLVGTEVGEPVDVFRGFSVVGRAGVTIAADLVGNLTIPKGTTGSTGYWLSTEATAATESTPVVGSIGLTPKTAGGFVQLSRLLTLQAPAVEGFLRRDLLGTVGALVDAAVLNGTGAAGQPLGLVNLSGVGSETGTSLAHAGVLSAQEKVAAAGVDDINVRWIGATDTRELLGARERASGNGGFLWDADRILNRPAFVSLDAPSASLFVGDWSQCVVATWGAGVQVEFDPASGFASGILGARILLPVDIAFRKASAFVKITAVT